MRLLFRSPRSANQDASDRPFTSALVSTVATGEVVVVFQILSTSVPIAIDMIVSVDVAVHGAAETDTGILELQPIE